MDEDYYILTLMAVARELSLAGLTRADVQYCYGGKACSVHLVGCTVYPQFYLALYSCFGEMRGTTMLADIGNGTMNILYLIDGRPSESRSWTEKQGVNQCVIATRNVVMDKFGVKIDDSIIEQILRTGTAAIGKPYLECTTAVALHDPDLPGHNPHAHILLTMRSLDEHGDWQYKTEKEYLCVCGDEEQGFTADEFDHAKLDGWDKQSLYKVGRKKVYMAPSAAEVIRYCVR